MSLPSKWQYIVKIIAVASVEESEKLTLDPHLDAD